MSPPTNTTRTEDMMNIEEEEENHHHHHHHHHHEEQRVDELVSPPPLYLPDQRCFCRDENDKEQFYEAVVRKVRCCTTTTTENNNANNEWEFCIHYLGWNSRWDRWVFKEDLVPDTPENRKRHVKDKKRKKDEATTTTGGGGSGGGGAGGGGNSTCRKRRTTASSLASSGTSGGGGGSGSASSSEDTLSYYQEYCELPYTLKMILVEECEKITRKGFDSPNGYDCGDVAPKPARSVHQLPPPVTIHQVLQHYQRKRGGTDQEQEKQQQVKRFCDGLGKLFCDALPICLLYPQERPQYEGILHTMEQFSSKNKSVTEIYGCEMLLRLLVRLPVLLQAEPKIDSSLSMGPLIADLIVLLQKNRQACFKAIYREPKPNELMDWELALAAAAAATTTTDATDVKMKKKKSAPSSPMQN